MDVAARAGLWCVDIGVGVDPDDAKPAGDPGARQRSDSKRVVAAKEEGKPAGADCLRDTTGQRRAGCCDLIRIPGVWLVAPIWAERRHWNINRWLQPTEDLRVASCFESATQGVIERGRALVYPLAVRAERHRNPEHINRHGRVGEPVGLARIMAHHHITSGAAIPSKPSPLASAWRVASTSAIRIDRCGSDAVRTGRLSISA